MKRCMAFVCMMATLLFFANAVHAEGTMYPHPEVAMELTTEEDTVTVLSGREWRKLSGTAVRPDMEHGELRYEVYLPEAYDSTKTYPVLLFLHDGSLGYRRSDGFTPWMMRLGGGNMLAERIAEAIGDCIIFAPQTPGALPEDDTMENAYWGEMPMGTVGAAITDKSESSPYLKAVEKMMASFLDNGISYSGDVYTIDSERLYVTGFSMGGIGTYTILRDCPDVFAAAIIGAGIGDPDTVETWKNTPVRILHGTRDTTISIKASETMAEALQTVRAQDAVFTPIEGEEHDIIWFMYSPENDEGKSESLSWMAKQRLGEGDNIFLYVGIAVVIVVIAGTTVIWALKRKKEKNKEE